MQTYDGVNIVYKSKLINFCAVLVCSLLPFYAFAADVIDDVGNGVKDAATSFGNLGEDLSNAVLGEGSSDTKTNSDASITTQIKTKIKQLETDRKIDNKFSLQVETKDGNVRIYGKVAKSADIDTIEKAANNIKGVKSLKMNVDVVS
jgi:osmotically-inducible protein OsmY